MKNLKGLIFFLVASVLLISFTYYGYQIVFTPNILVGKEDRIFVIPEGATFKNVQEEMHKGKVVQDLVSFSFLAKIMDYDTQIKPGRYILKSGMTNREVLNMLRAGNQVPVRVSIHNIRLVGDLAEKVTRNLSITPDEFSAALVSFTMQNEYGFNANNILTMFIPNTYEMYFNTSADKVVGRFYYEYEIFWNDERKAKAKKMGLTPIEVSVLASIVQAESVKKDEAPIIAGLYINRLKQGIALQADPTLVFALGDFTLKRVLNEHKEIESPYNTYKYPGLPPGPINMPEIATLDAVLNYQVNDYIYMCAREDFSGYHNFTASYNEHLRNAQRYQRALTIEQRKARSANK
jgi:UPF0755 protein